MSKLDRNSYYVLDVISMKMEYSKLLLLAKTIDDKGLDHIVLYKLKHNLGIFHVK